MPTRVKIKISDNERLRERLVAELERRTQIQACKYAILLAKHVLAAVCCDYSENPIVLAGFDVNEKRQNGGATVREVRQAGFEIHRLAKSEKDLVMQAALRAVGHSVSSGHMKEHAIVASDYAVKVVNLVYPDNGAAVDKERLWQIECLNGIV